MVAAVVVAALIVVAGSAHQDPERPSRSSGQAEAAGAGPVLAEIAEKDRLAARQGRRPRRGGAEHYRRTARKRVTTKGARAFLPLYREAARRFAVNWRLIASIHRQETAFSTAPSTYHGLNEFGCCAGPMQFNVTNGPPSTWESYRHAFRKARRPERYPHRTRKHPSIYDDFDAIMAAGSLLSDSGAGPSLDEGAWSAAYSYYGHDLFGVTYASQILARAVAWERDGFCPNCPLDEGLVAEFDDAYGAPIREQLLAAERRRKKEERARDDKADRERRARRRRKHDDAGDRASRRSPAARRRPATRKTRPSPPRPRRRNTVRKPAAPPPAATQTPTTTAAAPAPPPPDCNGIRKLLGC